VVSRAFQILSDADKKAQYDRTGGDPDSRFGAGSPSAGASPFSGFARSQGGGPMFNDEISPEELFNRFFGGGGFGGGPFGMRTYNALQSYAFGTNIGTEGGFGGPGFVFNMGGGPGFTVHQMGGRNPRRRPRNGNEPEQSGSALMQLLPLLLLFILPLLSSLFSGEGSSGPGFRFDAPQPPMTMHRVTPKHKVDYYVNPKEVDGWQSSKLRDLDKKAENEYIHIMQYQCADETQRKRNEIQDAHGFFFTDEARLKRARERRMPACERLDDLRVVRRY
jgi:DnaJ homolog subfamily B member 12